MKLSALWLVLVAALLGALYGFAVGRYEAFPSHLLDHWGQDIERLMMSEEETRLADEARQRLEAMRAAAELEAERARARNRIRKDRNAELRKLYAHFTAPADVVFLGDSLTYLGRWAEFFPSVSALNRGVGGEGVSDALARLDAVIATRPRRVFIMLGINDIRRAVPVETIASQYVHLVERLRAEGIDVVVQSTVQCYEPVCGPETVAAVNALNGRLATLADGQDWMFVDLGALSDRAGLDEQYTHDGIHLTFSAYRYWAERIQSLVQP